jgi:isovaleryl-CoA dehydrogenase
MCFGQIQKHIAESLAKYMAGKSYLYEVTNGLDLSSCIDRAIQVMGGYGNVGEYNVERFWVSHVLLHCFFTASTPCHLQF